MRALTSPYALVAPYPRGQPGAVASSAMSATETWLVVAAIVAAAGAGLHLASPPIHVRIPHALVAAALACLAVALVVAFP